MKALNFIHFHRRRILVAATFTGCYSYLCYKATSPTYHDILRMGVAGSLANVVVESAFHFADTVNVRAKISDGNDSSMKIVQKIYAKEGIKGFSKGFSACFYGSVFCGFIYFSLYKMFKGYFKEFFDPSTNVAAVYFVASFVAEFFTLLVYYPYDLIKCRLQSKNYFFKYRNLPHAFRKEISEGSIFSLYKGSFPFLVTYCLFVSV
jgi:Mitochondrial carrier protein